MRWVAAAPPAAAMRAVTVSCKMVIPTLSSRWSYYDLIIFCWQTISKGHLLAAWWQDCQVQFAWLPYFWLSFHAFFRQQRITVVWILTLARTGATVQVALVSDAEMNPTPSQNRVSPIICAMICQIAFAQVRCRTQHNQWMLHMCWLVFDGRHGQRLC